MVLFHGNALDTHGSREPVVWILFKAHHGAETTYSTDLCADNSGGQIGFSWVGCGLLPPCLLRAARKGRDTVWCVLCNARAAPQLLLMYILIFFAGVSLLSLTAHVGQFTSNKVLFSLSSGQNLEQENLLNNLVSKCQQGQKKWAPLVPKHRQPGTSLTQQFSMTNLFLHNCWKCLYSSLEK